MSEDFGSAFQRIHDELFPTQKKIKVNLYQSLDDAVAKERDDILIKVYREMPYADYLASAHWQLIRAKYKERIGGILFCQLDRKHSGPFDIHHNTYERRGAEIYDDLVCLCRACHEKHHGGNHG